MKLTSMKTDPAKEAAGVWTPFGGGIELLIARLGNAKAEAFIRQKGRPLRQQIRSGTATDEDLEALSKEAIARHVLLDWRNVEDDDGAPLSYTPELGLQLFNDPQYRDLYRFVTEAAADRQRFIAESLEELAGNSESDSSGA